MPKTKNTLAQKKENLRKILNPDHIINETTIFKSDIGSFDLHLATVDKIQSALKRWFNSWVKDDLDDVLGKQGD